MRKIISSWRDKLTWQSGRQGSGYERITLCQWTRPISFDGYVIRYPVESFIPPHIDPVTDKRHYRLNIILKPAGAGGEFICNDIIVDLPRLKLFRPDKYTHEVTKVRGSPRYVLSFGVAL